MTPSPISGERTVRVAVDIGGMHFAVNIGLADAARDQLRDLGTKIEDDDSVVSHGRRTPQGCSISVMQE